MKEIYIVTVTIDSEEWVVTHMLWAFEYLSKARSEMYRHARGDFMKEKRPGVETIKHLDTLDMLKHHANAWIANEDEVYRKIDNHLDKPGLRSHYHVFHTTIQ